MGFLDEFGHQVSLVFKRFPMLLGFGVSSFLVKTIFFTHLSLNLRINPLAACSLDLTISEE